MNGVDIKETRACLCLAARRAARTITREFDRVLRPHGLRSTQFSVLAVLGVAGPRKVTELAEILSADRTTMTRNLAVLKSRGLVAVHAGKDARERIAHVTDAGRNTITSALEDWRGAQTRLSRAMGQDAADGLRTLAWMQAA